MKKIAWLSLFLLVVASSCSKDHAPSIPNYTVPTTYTFTHFNDSNVLKLLAMADQIAAKINTANTAGVVVSGQQLKDMFNNVNGYFVDSAWKLNASGLKLASYCSSAAATDLMSYFDSVGLYSPSTVAGSNGVAGRLASSVNAGKKLLLSPGGLWYYQVVRKTFNDITAAAITTLYLKDSVANSTNNTTVIPGSGTAMEHYWDEAFGFFAVPVDFPSNKTGLRYFGSYSNQVDAGLGCNATIMNAFLKGRAAISAKDLMTKTAQAKILVTTFEQLTAASVVQEMKETDANIDAGDAVSAYGTLSETLGFIRGLKYYTNGRTITDAQITQLLQLIDNAHPNAPNLYNFLNVNVNTPSQIKAKTDAIRQFIGQVYGFTAAQLAGGTTGKDPILTNIGNNIILPAYASLGAAVNSLDSAIVDFNAAPGSVKLSAVQTLFKTAYVSWESVSAYDGFGPAYTGQPVLAGLNLFPTNTTTIEGNITAGNNNVNAFANASAKGFPALDYLLYGAGANTLTGFTTGAGAANRRAYLAAVSADIKAEANAALKGWQASGGNYITSFIGGTGNSVSSSLGLLINSLVQDLEIGKNDRLGIPLGKQPPGQVLPVLPNEVEAYYSGISVQLALAQLKALQNIYLGVGTQGSGPGLKDYVIQKKIAYNGGLLDDALKANFASAVSGLQAIPDPFSATIQSNAAPANAVYATYQQLVVLLKTDLASGLGVLITFGDNDGD